MTQSIRNIYIGVCAFCVLIIGVYIVSIGQKAPASNTYYATFRTIEGIKVDAPVYIFGIQVGRVSNIELSQGMVNVAISVDADVPIPIDSSLEVQTLGLFAQKSMVVSLGFEADILQHNTHFTYTGNAVDVIGLLNQSLDRNITKREKNE